MARLSCLLDFNISKICDNATGKGHVAAIFDWSENYDRNTGFGKVDVLMVRSKVSKVLSWNPGCGWLTIQTAMGLLDSRTEVDILGPVLPDGLAVDSKASLVNVLFTTYIKLSQVENGTLSIAVETTPPLVETNVSSWTLNALKRLFGGDPTKRNADLAARVREKVRNVFADTGIRDEL